MPQPKGFTPDQVARYARHLILPEVGGAGQRKLLGSSVLLLGAGGLGSPAGMYLAAAGLGKIGIVDFDNVDASNLQRQLLHTSKDIGRPKVDSAADTLRSLNPDVEVVPINEHLNSETAMRIFAPYDIIVDGTGWPCSTPPKAQGATAAFSRSRLRRARFRAAPRQACSASCPGSSAA
jgi:adenylyltransferase/sulfurtransferase